MKTKRLLIPLLVAALITSILLSGCSKKNETGETGEGETTRTGFLLDTVCSIKLYDGPNSKALDSAFKRLQDVENKMSINTEKSELIDINNAAGEKSVKVSEDTYNVIKRGKQFGDISGGVFDISIGPMVRLWGIGTDKARVPAQAEINDKLKFVNYKNIILNDQEKSVMLKNKGMIIDLGGIAKGYAADIAKKALLENGVKHAIINLGGDVLTVGSKPDGSKWNVGVQNPFAPRGAYVGIVSVKDKTVESSGVYERYFEQNGKRYHHMLSPFNGYPFENELVSVTIVTDKSIDGDGYSTTVFGKGLEKGLEFAKTQKDIEAILITSNSEVYVTPGLKGSFRITDSSFKLMN
jgi:thiamine biosynthesis lipoprotein